MSVWVFMLSFTHRAYFYRNIVLLVMSSSETQKRDHAANTLCIYHAILSYSCSSNGLPGTYSSVREMHRRGADSRIVTRCANVCAYIWDVFCLRCFGVCVCVYSWCCVLMLLSRVAIVDSRRRAYVLMPLKWGVCTWNVWMGELVNARHVWVGVEWVAISAAVVWIYLLRGGNGIKFNNCVLREMELLWN